MPTLTTNKPLLDAEFLAKLDRLDLISRKILLGRVQGERRSKKRGQSVEFADYRQYVVGDDLRRIDWNLYARLDRLFLRLFMEEEDLSLSILLDVTRSMDYGEPSKLDFAKRLTAALAYIGLVKHNRVSLYAFSHTLQQALINQRGRRPLPHMLDFLQQLTPASEPQIGDLSASCKRFALSTTGKGVVILISDFFDKGELSTALRYLAGERFDVYVIQVLAPQEIDPVKGQLVGDLQLVDIEDTNAADVSVNSLLIKRYQANLQAYCQHLREQCVRRDMVYLATDTSVSFETVVLRYLRERGLLG